MMKNLKKLNRENNIRRMDKMVQPYLSIIHNGRRLFRINPAYTEIFSSLGIEQNNTFFRANPFNDGLHGEYSHDDMHFQVLERYGEKIDGKSFYFVKKETAILSDRQLFSKEEIEDYFELYTSVEYILFKIEDLNEYARENYKEGYITGLKEKISLYKKENNFRENIFDH